MRHRLRSISAWLPEALIFCALGYFACRKLGSFPAAWADDSLFMIVAKMIAMGRGYVLPILGYDWQHPFVLAVGPTLIFPAALSMRIFGMTIAAARAPMVIFLFAASVCAYLYVRDLAGKSSARWSLALLVSLSAFVNIGKEVMGEVPGFAFLMLGILLLRRRGTSLWTTVAIGLALGLAIITKITYGLLLPVLGIAGITALLRRDRSEVRFLSLIIAVLLIVLLIGAYWLGAYTRGFFVEIEWFVLGRGEGPGLFNILLQHPVDLLRMHYAHYLLVSFFGILGWLHLRRKMDITESIIILSLIILFAIYFLNGSGWYRHLLPSTLLLLLFFPVGLHRVFPSWIAISILVVIIGAQGWWQWTYRGANPSTEAKQAAQVIATEYTQVPMVILPAEVFVYLPDNPLWLFFSAEMQLSGRRPAGVEARVPGVRCLPEVRRVSSAERANPPPRSHVLFSRYMLFDPPADCPSVP